MVEHKGAILNVPLLIRPNIVLQLAGSIPNLDSTFWVKLTENNPFG